MAIVLLTGSHSETLDDGSTIYPKQIRNIDANQPTALRLIREGKMVLVDSYVTPEPVEDLGDLISGFDIWVWIAQSNGSGRGLPFDIVRHDVPNDRIWQWGGPNSHFPGEITLGIEPYDQVDTPSGISPAGEMYRRLLLITPQNRRILHVGCALGGAGMRSNGNAPYLGQWKKTYAGPNFKLYENAVTQTLAAKAAAGPGARIVGVGFIQGEGDGGNTANYRADLEELIDGFREDVGEPDLAFVINQMVPDYITGNRAIIDDIHKQTPARRYHTEFVYGPAPGYVLPDGSPHYDARGNRIAGGRMAEGYVRALTNSPYTLPQTPGEVTAVQSGDELLVGWTQAYGHKTDYQVKWRHGTSGPATTLVRTPSIDVSAVIPGIVKGDTYQVKVATVNDKGVSAFSGWVTIETVTEPGQVTGLLVGEVEGSRVPLTWDETDDATYYLVEQEKDGDVVYSESAVVTEARADITSLLASTGYSFIVTPGNAAGLGTPSDPVEAVTGPLAYLMTDVGHAARQAYALSRLLDSDYDGPLWKVRRSSDDATLDIGHIGGLADLASAVAHVDDGDGYLVTIYDQSGNGRDIGTAILASQPRIVQGGVVDLRLANPFGIWDGIDDYMSRVGTGGIYAAGHATALAVFAAAVQSGDVLWEESSSGVALAVYGQEMDSAQRLVTQITTDAGVNLLFANHGQVAFTGDPVQTTWVDDGSAVIGRVNGVQGTSRPYVRGGVLTLDRFGLGAFVRSGVTNHINMALGELVIWDVALTAEQYEAGEANQQVFYGTP